MIIEMLKPFKRNGITGKKGEVLDLSPFMAKSLIKKKLAKEAKSLEDKSK